MNRLKIIHPFNPICRAHKEQNQSSPSCRNASNHGKNTALQFRTNLPRTGTGCWKQRSNDLIALVTPRPRMDLQRSGTVHPFPLDSTEAEEQNKKPLEEKRALDGRLLLFLLFIATAGGLWGAMVMRVLYLAYEGLLALMQWQTWFRQ